MVVEIMQPDSQFQENLSLLVSRFTEAALEQRPNDLVEFAANYFADIRHQNKFFLTSPETLRIERVPSARRKSVRAESIDPAKSDPAKEGDLVVAKTEHQWQRLNRAVSRIYDKLFLYNRLNPKQQEKVKAAMSERHVKANEIVIKEGEEGSFFYIIDSGTFQVYRELGVQEIVLCTHEGSGYFGELALMYNDPRNASVRAVTDGNLWCLHRHAFKATILVERFKQCSEFEQFLRQVPLIISSLSEEEIWRVADCLTSHDYPPNAVIVDQGDEPDGMYFVHSGTVKVTCEGVYVKSLKAGDYFGEVALLSKGVRSATVTAEDPVVIYKLSINDFERLLGPCGDVLSRNIQVYKEERAKLGLD